MSFPPGTEMFQFPGFASATYGFSDGYSLRSGLPHSEIPGSKPARGSPRLFAACHVLHRLLAPRHPPDALAFLHPRQPPPQTHPARSPTVGGSWPTRTHFARARQERSGEGTVAGGFQRLLPQRAVLARNGPHTHARCAPCPRDGKTKKKGQNARLADARHARRMKDRSSMPATGTSSPPHDVQTASACHNARLCRARERLVGLGRLERPTSRLSGVRSNQLSYRPKHATAGNGHPSQREGHSGPAGKVAGEGTCRRRRAHDPRRPVKVEPATPFFATGRPVTGGVAAKFPVLDSRKGRQRKVWWGNLLERR
jgi:hypothetical protein